MNDEGSIYPVAMFIILVCIAGFLLLLAGTILEPFFNLMRDGAMKTFLLIVFPGGLTVFILIVLIGALWMRYQKEKYGGLM